MIYDTYDSQRRLFYVSLEVCSHRHFYHTVKSNDSSQARTATRFDVAPVRVVQKTLRSPMELRILYRTTFSDSSSDVMCSLQVEKSEQVLHVGARPTSTRMTA